MRRILRRYDNLSIKTKFISVILLTLFIFGCVCLAGLRIVNRSNQKLLYNTMSTSLTYTAKEIRDSLAELESLSFDMIVDNTVQNQLAKLKGKPDEDQSEGMFKTEVRKALNTSIQNFKTKNQAIGYISLISDYLSVDTNPIWMEKISDTARDTMKEQTIEAAGRATWIYQPEAENPLFLTRCVNRIEPHWLDTLGVLFVNVNMKTLVESSGDFESKHGEVFYQLKDGVDLLYQTDNFPQEMEESLSGFKEGEYRILTSGLDRYFAITGTIPDYGWQYIHMVSYNEMYMALSNSLMLYLLVVVLGAIASVIFCHLLVNRLTIHIFTLSDKMQEFSHNNEKVPKVSYDYSNRQDELGLLHRKFDDMAEEIIYLIQNDYTNKLLMKDAQLKALEAQIDPHFLYNVLQSISWSAKEIGDEQIPSMVDALGKMLRTTLSPEDEEFTIGKEVEFVGNYMTIQQYRFEGQLEFAARIQEEMLSVKIPKLTIQPLVENAIRYSMEACEETCCIEVSGEFGEEEILITVKNSGSVFEEDLIHKLETKQVKTNGFGIGLLNIKKRLNLFCGDAAYLQLKNEDGWAIAAIHIPASHYKEALADAKDDNR